MLLERKRMQNGEKEGLGKELLYLKNAQGKICYRAPKRPDENKEEAIGKG